MFIKGRIKQADNIKLPEYWKDLVHADSINVSLTPIGDFQELSVVAINLEESEIRIKENTNKLIDCFYTIIAIRKDVESLQVEIENP